jgi:murein endopeptidase
VSLIKFVKSEDTVALRLLIDCPKEWVDCKLKVHPPAKAGSIIFLDKETAYYFIKNKWAEPVSDKFL